jgi:deoxyribose-phosphate aldolase
MKNNNIIIAKTIEHTLLRNDTTANDIRNLCDEALHHDFLGVCIPPYFVKEAVRRVKEAIKVVTVVGFPMGYSTVPAKVEEIKKALDEGADEVDAVVNIAAVKSNDKQYLHNEISSMMRAVAMRGKKLKLIVEYGVLSKEDILKIMPIIEKEEVDFVKTSTGFNGTGATVEAVKFLRESCSPRIKIKASGGIKTREQVQALLTAGADRIGTSNGLQIILP